MSPQHWPSFLRQIHALEQSWNAHKVSYPRDDAVHFLPLPIPQFISLLTDAVMAAPVRWDSDGGGALQSTFIDVGCGPGTKARLAQELFGLEVYGIDIVPAFVAEARSMGLTADVMDAFREPAYSEFDIVFVNRPSALQDELEQLICERVGHGCVLMAANWRHDPEEFGLQAVVREYERPVCGVWRKPE